MLHLPASKRTAQCGQYHGGEQRVIQIEDLSFRYPVAARDAIQGLSLRVDAGSLFGLLGPNGSGKTTLISILMGLLEPDRGTVRIDGHGLPAQARQAQEFSALVPQDHAFYPRLNVQDNLRFFGGALAIPPPELRERLAEAIAITGLEAFLGTPAEHLSGGLKRRLNLAIGLLNRPRLLFLDEPTVGIDPQSRHFILESIRRINAGGTTVVYTTHYMEEVEALCDEIGILDDGRLLARGTLAQLLNNAAGHELSVNLTAPPSAAQQTVLQAMPGVRIDGSTLRRDRCDPDQVAELLGTLTQQGLAVSRMQYGYGNLEELFLHLTGRQLRD